MRIIAQNVARTRACASAARLTLPHNPFNGTFAYIQTLLRGDSEEIDFLGLHLDTNTHIASQWDGFIDTKTFYNHFLNIKSKCTIGLPSAPLRFAWAHTGGYGPSTQGELTFSTAALKSHEPNCQACLHSAKDTTQATRTAYHATLLMRFRSHDQTDHIMDTDT